MPCFRFYVICCLNQRCTVWSMWPTGYVCARGFRVSLMASKMSYTLVLVAERSSENTPKLEIRDSVRGVDDITTKLSCLLVSPFQVYWQRHLSALRMTRFVASITSTCHFVPEFLWSLDRCLGPLLSVQLYISIKYYRAESTCKTFLQLR